jgi:hypothetical protein
MSNIPRAVSAPVEYIPVLSTHFARRLAVCVLLTVLDIAVTGTCAPTLYQVSSGHPAWLAGLAVCSPRRSSHSFTSGFARYADASARSESPQT